MGLGQEEAGGGQEAGLRSYFEGQAVGGWVLTHVGVSVVLDDFSQFKVS